MKIVDMHCDTISELLNCKRRGESCELRSNALHVDLERMTGADYLLQNFALFVDVGNSREPWEDICELHDLYTQELTANSDVVAPVYSYEDIERNKASGKISAMLTVEEGAVCGGEIGRLEQLYDMGVRMLTLTWNYKNELASPNLNSEMGKKIWEQCRRLRTGECSESEAEQIELQLSKYMSTPNTTGGLTECGREFASRMEQLGMIIDVSHLSDAGFYDIMQYSTKPFVASHSNAREVCGCVRNLTDHMIRSLAERGGCMGLNFCADFLETPSAYKVNSGNIQSVVKHAAHIVNVGGIEVLGLGSDFDGIDTNAELPGVQSMGRLWEAMRKEGFTEGQLDKIFGENVLRVYRDVL